MAAFLAFGRTRYDEPLRQVGRLDEDASAAAEIARQKFGDGLIELSLVPESDIRWVLGHEDANE